MRSFGDRVAVSLGKENWAQKQLVHRMERTVALQVFPFPVFPFPQRIGVLRTEKQKVLATSSVPETSFCSARRGSSSPERCQIQ